jgi:hypothetical protein
MWKIDSVKTVKKVNLWFREKDWRELKAISRESDVPVSALVRRIVAEWLKKRKRD